MQQPKEHPLAFTPDMMAAIYSGRKTETRRIIRTQPSRPDMQMTTVLSTTADWRKIGKHRWVTLADDGYTTDVEDDVLFSQPCQPGDLIVPRSTWAVMPQFDELKPSEINPAEVAQGFWVAGMGEKSSSAGKSRPGRFFPRALWGFLPRLLVTGVTWERIQDIKEDGAKAEGVAPLFSHDEIHKPSYSHELDLDPMPYRNYLWHGYIGAGITRKQAEGWDYQHSSYSTAVGSFSSLWESINAKRGYGWFAHPAVWVIEFEVIL